MLQLLIYNSPAEPPRHLAGQIRSALLEEWPEPADACVIGELLIAPELHPTYFLLVEVNQLLSYARTIWMTVAHQGQHLKLYGLGDVITVPEYRHKGYAGRIIDEATAHIRSDPEADAAVLLTRLKLEALYGRSGWESIPGLQVTTGEHDEQEARKTIPMMLFLSVAACTARASFTSHTLVLPGDEW